MAIRELSISSKVYVPVCSCDSVAICLANDPWASRTVSGFPFVVGRVSHSGRFLGSSGKPRAAEYENVRCEERYQYTFVYDDSQLLEDPGTTAPYEVPCKDVKLVDACLVQGVIEILGGGGEGALSVLTNNGDGTWTHADGGDPEITETIDYRVRQLIPIPFSFTSTINAPVDGVPIEDDTEIITYNNTTGLPVLLQIQLEYRSTVDNYTGGSWKTTFSHSIIANLAAISVNSITLFGDNSPISPTNSWNGQTIEYVPVPPAGSVDIFFRRSYTQEGGAPDTCSVNSTVVIRQFIGDSSIL